MDKDTQCKSWQVIGSEAGPDLALFQVRFDRVQNPRNGSIMNAVVLESPDWVNVVAITPQKQLVVVCQHRLGIGRRTIEIPAGIIEKGETPESAASRELLEETGYTSERWEYLGWVEPNPAFMNNRCHFWLAHDVIKTHELALDEGEDITIRVVAFEEVLQEIQAGRMRNVFSLAALGRVYDLRGSLEEKHTDQ